jgi:hypothetical protein
MRWLMPLGLALLVGCGGPRKGTVTGEVKVDGKPLATGFIVFTNTEGKTEPVTAPIENGRYQVETILGLNRVQISAPLVEKRKDVDITKETLPKHYNAASELTFEVTSSENTKNWELTTKEK